jgi:hypothetical protein
MKPSSIGTTLLLAACLTALAGWGAGQWIRATGAPECGDGCATGCGPLLDSCLPVPSVASGWGGAEVAEISHTRESIPNETDPVAEADHPELASR